MINFTYNGHGYSFDPNTNHLMNSEGIEVARIELAQDYDEYNHYIDVESDEIMYSAHVNEILFVENHIFLAGQYEEFQL